MERAMPELRSSIQPDLSGQVALVTGGGRGLGKAFAQALAAAGAAIAVVSRSEEQLADTVATIAARGGQAIAIPADVTNPEAIERMAAMVHQELGPIDLLINNAAVMTPLGPTWEVDPDAWWHCMESNVRGPFLCSRAVLPHMVKRGRGRIINVASNGALRVIPGYSAYGTSKAALIRLTETLAAETKSYGLQVFAIHPGLVKTAMTEYLAESPEGQKWIPWIREVFATGRETPLASAVDMVLFLASGRGDCLTGRFLRVTDNLAGMAQQMAQIEQEDWYTLGLRLPPA
jgi:NAD(P)-dependent dehydrogenase (short-subunit alcohol dehydrogenase family)